MVAQDLADAGLTDADIQGKIIYLVSGWLEGLLYGMYATLVSSGLAD